MELNELLTKQYERVWSATDRAIEGLSDDALAWRPSPECNSIGWLAWHVGRVEDRWASLLLGRELRGSGFATSVDDQWARKWAAAMGMPGDGGSGAGMPPSDLDAFPTPSLDLLQGYYQAVRADTRAMLAALRPGALDEARDSLFGRPMALSDMFVQVLTELNQHTGQMGYIKGLYAGYQGPGGAEFPGLSPKR